MGKKRKDKDPLAKQLRRLAKRQARLEQRLGAVVLAPGAPIQKAPPRPEPSARVGLERGVEAEADDAPANPWAGWERREQLRLLERYQTDEWNAIQVYTKHKDITAAVLMAMIGAGVASLAADTEWVVLLGALVPLFVRRLAMHFRLGLDRFYARFLEAVVMQHKLRANLGLEREDRFAGDPQLYVVRCDRGFAPTASSAWVREHLELGDNRVTAAHLADICKWSLVLTVIAAVRLDFLVVEKYDLGAGGIFITVAFTVLTLGFLGLAHHAVERDAGLTLQRSRDARYGPPSSTSN